MSYVEQNLLPGESVRLQGRLHWIVFASPVALLVASALLVVIPVANDGGVVGYERAAVLVALVTGIIQVARLIEAGVLKWTTEMAVTDRRVILKRGLIWRKAIDLRVEKVESLLVDQGILGRLLGFGSLSVGSGASRELFHAVADPIGFRNAVHAVADERGAR